jgi:hypothetical protein
LDGCWVRLDLCRYIRYHVCESSSTVWEPFLTIQVINAIPGLHFRANEEAEIVGMDEIEHDEYVADYAWLERDVEAMFESRVVRRSRGSIRQASLRMSPSRSDVSPVTEKRDAPAGDNGESVEMREVLARGRGEDHLATPEAQKIHS